MKVLIWIGCFIVATILNSWLGLLTGIRAGYLVFYLAVYFVAKKLCSKWDEHKKTKAEQKKPVQQKKIIVEDKPKIVVDDQVRFCRKCGTKLIDDSQFCRKCGTQIVKE